MDYFIVELAQKTSTIAIPLEQVQEVISVNAVDICPIPGVSEAILGMMNQRGNLIWLLDLSLLLLNDRTLNNQIRSAKVIIATIEQKKIGLIVSKLQEIKELLIINPQREISNYQTTDYFIGITDNELAEPIAVIDLDKINHYLSLRN